MSDSLSFLPESTRDRLRTDLQFAAKFFAANPDLQPGTPPASPKKPAAAPAAPAPVTVTAFFYRTTLPIRMQTESNTGGTWQANAARAKAQRRAVRQHLGGIGMFVRLALPVRITLIRIGRNRRPMDDDNVSSSAKHVRDELALIIGVDDGSSQVSWHYGQRRGEADAVEITIERAGAKDGADTQGRGMVGVRRDAGRPDAQPRDGARAVRHEAGGPPSPVRRL